MKSIILTIVFFTTLFAKGQDTLRRMINSNTIEQTIVSNNGQILEQGKLKLLPINRTGMRDNNSSILEAFYRDGKWVEYYQNGNKKRVVIYEKGLIKKVRRSWKENGARDKTTH